MRYEVTVGGRPFVIDVAHGRPVLVNGHPIQVDLEQIGDLPVYSLVMDNGVYIVLVEGEEGEYQVEVDGRVYSAQVRRGLPHLLPREPTCADEGELCLVVRAPLAGSLISVPVTVGGEVESGQVVAVLESMKMQMELRVPHSGRVEMIHTSPGAIVGQGEALVTLRRE